jgi:hypothetical protein
MFCSYRSSDWEIYRRHVLGFQISMRWYKPTRTISWSSSNGIIFLSRLGIRMRRLCRSLRCRLLIRRNAWTIDSGLHRAWSLSVRGLSPTLSWSRWAWIPRGLWGRRRPVPPTHLLTDRWRNDKPSLLIHFAEVFTGEHQCIVSFMTRAWSGAIANPLF